MNTDWNSPQGDFDTAEKQGELLMLLSRQQVTVHTWDDPDFDYMEEQDITAILDGKAGALSLYTENGWQGTVLCTELPGAEDAAVALKRCWQAAKPDAALPAGSRLELVCWDPAQNRKVQLPAE